MAIHYVLQEMANPQKPDEPKKIYGKTKSQGDINLKELGKEISEGSTTVSDSDVLAVLNDLTKFMRRHLSEGKIVRLGDFGSFQISISSEGVDSPEKFNASKIKGNKIIYRPGSDMKEMLATVKYVKD